MEPDAAVSAFAVHLRRLHAQVGRPSLAKLVRLGHGKYQKSTISEHLSGRRSKLATWDFVEFFVQACHDYASNTQQPLGALAGIDEWYKSYLLASMGITDPPYPQNAPRTGTDAETSGPTMSLSRSALQQVVGELEREDTSSGLFKHRLTLPFVEGEELPHLDSIPLNTALLLGLNRSVANRLFVVDGKITAVGRGERVGIRILDNSISKLHAEIRLTRSGFTIRDCDSKNGTYINRIRLAAEHYVRLGDSIHFGETRFIFLTRPDPEPSITEA